jgi:predicted RNase H-like HicB family nuclease
MLDRRDVTELVFEVTEDSDGGYTAECLTENIFTQGDSWDELRANVKEAVEAFYFDKPSPDRVRLHLVRDEMFALR